MYIASQVAWRSAVDLGALAKSGADAALLVGMLLRRRVHAHPSTDICALATDVIKVLSSMHVMISLTLPLQTSLVLL